MNIGYVDVNDLPTELRREIGEDERIVWSGRPLGGVRLKRSDAFMIPFSLVWGGFVLFWNASVWYMGAPLFFRLWGVPFLVIGLYITVGRFFVDAKMRSRTAYALTERRAIIVGGLWSPSVRSVDLHSVPEINFSESSNGIGTITFGASEPFAPFGRGTRARAPQFEIIENARNVYERVRATQLKATK